MLLNPANVSGPVTADVIRVIDGDTISFPDGRNPAQEMLSAGYISPQDGGRKSTACSSW